MALHRQLLHCQTEHVLSTQVQSAPLSVLFHCWGSDSRLVHSTYPPRSPAVTCCSKDSRIFQDFCNFSAQQCPHSTLLCRKTVDCSNVLVHQRAIVVTQRESSDERTHGLQALHFVPRTREVFQPRVIRHHLVWNVNGTLADEATSAGRRFTLLSQHR